MTDSHDPGCSICGYYARLKPEQIIWQDENWMAAGLLDVPGWVMVATRRHSDGIWDINEAEAAGLGPMLPRLAGAIRTATSAERVHMAAQGENALHFHFVLMPRRAGETPVFDSDDLVRRAASTADAAAAAAVADELATLTNQVATA